MSVFEHPEFREHEQVVHWADPVSGLRSIIAVHNTTRGPALGGCRIWPYPTEDAALTDVLRLSRGMSYKSALANLPLGGGKSVIIGDARRDKTPQLLDAMGEAIESLGGRYIAAEDSGTTVADLKRMALGTRHVVGIKESAGWDGKMRNGDPSPATAYGCFVGLKTAVRHRFGSDSLEGVRVGIQGFGNVGRHLAQLLHDVGATLTVADIHADQTALASQLYGAKIVGVDDIYDAEFEVFAPCALGATLNQDTVGRLKAKVVAGSANNQLARREDGAALAARDILYAPDYAINAGGIIDVASEYRGYDPKWVKARLDGIALTLDEIFTTAKATGQLPHQVANRIAEARLTRRVAPDPLRSAA